MGFIALKCPSCNADIQLNDTQEFGFCQYCGTKIVQDVQKISITVENEVKVQGISTVDNLLIRVNQYLEEKEFTKALEYIDKIFDIDANNQTAHKLKKEIEQQKINMQIQSSKNIRLQSLIQNAESELSKSNFKKAKQYIDDALYLEPNNHKVLKLKDEIDKNLKHNTTCIIAILIPFFIFVLFWLFICFS